MNRADIDTIILFFVFNGVALAICSVIYFLATKAAIKKVRTALKFSALGWGILLFCTYSLITVVELTCDGSVLFGYRNCSFFTNGTTDFIALATVIFTVIAPIWAIVMLVIAAIIEWVFRRKPSQIDPS